MTIRVLCVGRVRERFFQDAAGEYMKRLTRYAKIGICEVPDEKAPENLSEADRKLVLKKEGDRLLAKIREQDYVIALAVNGTPMSSELFAARIGALMNSGKSSIAFVIGGSLGLSGDVQRRADEAISFSAMTFPHQLMRVILLEQIYRAEKILSGEPYHK